MPPTSLDFPWFYRLEKCCWIVHIRPGAPPLALQIPLVDGPLGWGWHSAEVEYGAHIWTGRRLRVKTKTLGGGSRDFEFWDFYPTFSVNPHWNGFWNCQHFASCLFCFSKMWKWKIRKRRKMNRKTKSRVHELYFGTNISRKLPVGFENGSNEDRDHDLVLTRNTKCLASPHLLVFVVFPVWS